MGVYHLMTVEQLQRVGAADGSKRRVRRGTDAADCASTWSPGRTRKPSRTATGVPAVHWLVPKGAPNWARDGDRIGGFRGVHQTRHRLAIVDVHIALREWAHGAGAGVTFVGGLRTGRSTAAEAHHARLRRPQVHPGCPDGRGAGQRRAGGARARDRARGAPSKIGIRSAKAETLARGRRGSGDGARSGPRCARQIPDAVPVGRDAAEGPSGTGPRPSRRRRLWRRFYCKGMDELADFNGVGGNRTGRNAPCSMDHPRSGSTLPCLTLGSPRSPAGAVLAHQPLRATFQSHKGL